MENASKALLIAGGVLIAIILFSLMTYLFSIMADRSRNIYKEFDDTDITRFNQQFLNYEDRGTTLKEVELDDGTTKKVPVNPLNIQDVITIVNIARDNNQTSKLPTDVKVKVKIDDKEEEWQDEKIKLSEKLRDNLGNRFKCVSILIGDKSKLVYEVNIEKIN